MPPINISGDQGGNIRSAVPENWFHTTISGDASASFQEVVLRNRFSDMVEESRSVKKKPLLKQFEDISKSNTEVFISIKKLQEEINTLETDTLNKLAEKYDTALFLFIGRDYTLKGVPLNRKVGYMNTLRQVIFSQFNILIRHINSKENYTIECYNLMSRFVDINLMTKEVYATYIEMFGELYDFHLSLVDKKKQKKSLMGIEDVKVSVCEDYLGVKDNGSIRISFAGAGGGGGN